MLVLHSFMAMGPNPGPLSLHAGPEWAQVLIVELRPSRHAQAVAPHVESVQKLVVTRMGRFVAPVVQLVWAARHILLRGCRPVMYSCSLTPRPLLPIEAILTHPGSLI